MAVPKSKSSSSSSSAEQTAREIKSLLLQLRKSSRQRKKQQRSGSVSTGNDRDDAQRLDKLRKIFARLIHQQEFDLNTSSGNDSASGSSASTQWKAWLTSQHETFISHLLEGIVAGRTTAVRTYCGVLASSPTEISGLKQDAKSSSTDDSKKATGMISERLLNKLLEAIVKSRQCFDDTSNNNNAKKPTIADEDNDSDDRLMMTEEPMLALVESEFIRPHRDVQYFVCKAVHQIALELLAGLERVQKLSSSKGKDVEKKEGVDGDDDIAKAERNAGIVAENLCRLLMMMDYVPKKQNDLDDSAGFLFTPPVLSDDNKMGDDDSDDDDVAVDDDSEEEDSDSSESSEEEEEVETTLTTFKKRKKRAHGSNNNKRSKKTKLIAWQQPYKHRNAHQEAWLSVLRLPNIPSRTQKLVLQHLSTYVLNVCPSPLRFAEYFTRSFQGGTKTTATATTAADSSSSSPSANSLTAILSLHGLFILMLDHQLEYPQFYNSLYSLLHPRILYTKHRSRFLRLLSKSLLSNSMLPAYVVASFCKRLCRLALSGPPSGGLFALALASNLLRKHGECACLIHRRGRNEDNGGLMEDAFEEEVDDLVKTRALESSLWELTALEKHYHPAIATLAKSVGTEDDKTTPMYDMEDFMAHTYKSLFEQEKKRLGGGGGGGGGSNSSAAIGGKKKRGGGKVSLTFVEPEGLFVKGDVFSDCFKCS